MTEHFQNELSNLDHLLNNLPENYCILEEKVDIEIQMTYYKALKDIEREELSDEEVAMLIATLNSELTTDDELKQTLVSLAGAEKVIAYRAIENYYKHLESGELKSWAAMAIQESKMLIQSQLMDEPQVFIASGLGGKGDKLRYFVAAFMKNDKAITDLQQTSITREFQFALENNESVLESIEFKQQYVLMNVLVPLKIDLRMLFKPAVKECSNLGIPIHKNLLLTNVKELDVEEIDSFINEQLEKTESTDE